MFVQASENLIRLQIVYHSDVHLFEPKRIQKFVTQLIQYLT